MRREQSMAVHQTERRIKELGELFFQLSADERLIARRLYQLLAKGKPVKLETLSQHSGVALPTIGNVVNEWPGVFLNDEGAVIGFWGLAIDSVSTHQFVVEDTTLYAWCAWDTLFMPAHIGKTCRVLSKCKQTGDSIRLDVSPGGVEYASPETVHLSFVLPDQAELYKDIVVNFCHVVHFFRDRTAAEVWSREQEGVFVLDLKDSAAAARHKILFEFQSLPVAIENFG